MGSITIDTFSAICAFGFVVMVLFIRHEAGRMGVDTRRTMLCVLWSTVGCFFVGRLVYLAVNWDYWLQNPFVGFEIWQGGLVSFGGIVGMLGGAAIYSVVARLPLGKVLDLAALTAPLAMTMGRVGCFCAGCDYGLPSGSLPFGVVFSHPLSLVPLHLHGVPLHPTQLYMSIANLVVFSIGYFLYRQNPLPGRVLGVVAVTYAVMRFGIEFFRGDLDRGFVFQGVLSVAQAFSILWFVFGIGVILSCGRGIWTKNV
jgi:phosphatidylglycerol---prolipoprotein diacylglyceryl transferase